METIKEIEEKAKAYDKALSLAKDYIAHMHNNAVNEYILAMFPELKENEDEKIMKRIIALVNAHGQGMYKDEMLSWLEKQGSQNLANSAKTCKDEQKQTNKVEPKFEKE